MSLTEDATQFNWTIFCTASGNPCNGNSDGVRDIIDGFGEATTISLNDDIGPLNLHMKAVITWIANAPSRRRS